MSVVDPLRLAEHLHGHLGWLSAAATLHPAILLRSPSRRAHWSVALAATMATAAGGLGVVLYPTYRERLRQPIFVQASSIGYLFERKEHLAFAAVFLTWLGAVAYLGALRAKGSARDSLRAASRAAFLAAAGFAVVAAVLGTIVAAYRTF